MISSYVGPLTDKPIKGKGRLAVSPGLLLLMVSMQGMVQEIPCTERQQIEHVLVAFYILHLFRLIPVIFIKLLSSPWTIQRALSYQAPCTRAAKLALQPSPSKQVNTVQLLEERDKKDAPVLTKPSVCWYTSHSTRGPDREWEL